MVAQAIAEEGASIAFVAPLAEPRTREPVHPNLRRIVTPRERLAGGSRACRVIASLTRIASGTAAAIGLRRSTRTFIFSIPEPLVFTLPLFAMLRVSGAHVIFIVHDAKPHAWSLDRRLRRLERGAHRLSYRLASALVALTPTVRDELTNDFGIAAKKIAVIPHGAFDVGNVAPMPGDGRLLLFGTLRRNKSVLEVIHGVIAARRQGHPVVLVLAGEPLKQETGYWAACAAATAQDPAGFDVRLGFLADAAVPELVSGVDAFVLAYSDFASQSGVAVLAALAGRPVIGTRAGGLGELFAGGMCGEAIAMPVTSDGIAAAIARFRGRSAEEWRPLAAEGQVKMAAKLSWRMIAKDYLKLARALSSSRDPCAGSAAEHRGSGLA
jgi:glycosyltransferase involved in cell wall biosynthesis